MTTQTSREDSRRVALADARQLRECSASLVRAIRNNDTEWAASLLYTINGLAACVTDWESLNDDTREGE